ncbi:MAG: hypothetical protein U9O56_07055 [Campylobacterota bacterium]|nr:hypothetical protein [Campylobacterota bacterium]
MFEFFKHKIISYIYKVSQQPVKLHELLAANQLFQEGMKLDGSKLGFRLRLGRAYVVFLLLAHIILIPIAFLFHEVFQVLDCHASIVIAIFFTALLFGIFNFFKDWTRDCVTQKRIKQMWSLHFPHFPFEEFSDEISKIYIKSLDDEIKHSNLERYILDKLSQ